MADEIDADALAAAVAFEEVEIVRSAIASGVNVNLIGRGENKGVRSRYGAGRTAVILGEAVR